VFNFVKLKVFEERAKKKQKYIKKLKQQGKIERPEEECLKRDAGARCEWFIALCAYVYESSV